MGFTALSKPDSNRLGISKNTQQYESRLNMDNTLLRSYKMEYDTGFAPNPYGEVLTLATCKPGIRRCAKKDDEWVEWVAGFTSKKLLPSTTIGQEKLIYLMKVDKKLRFEEYYEQYPEKRPDKCDCGDNIYRLVNGKYEQVPNKYHDINCCGEDTSSPYVLLATEFYYFGRDAVVVPEKYRPKVPKNTTECGCKTKDEQALIFIDWVKNVAAKNKHGLIGEPHGSKPGSCSKNKCKC
ncbi:MAG: hypothetical protein LBH03_05560 [Holophagales bacterium]|jgi:hypothetical protein|nr:hypothetical protein [Holophagales bacterium]